MKIKKTISLENNILELGEQKAKEKGLSFSAYLTTLINEDNRNEPLKRITAKKVDLDKIDNGIDDIIGG